MSLEPDCYMYMSVQRDWFVMAHVIGLFEINKQAHFWSTCLITCLGVSGSNVHTLHEIKIKHVLHLRIDGASRSLGAAECNM